MSENKGNHHPLEGWDPDDEEYWESKGKAIANKNLWISIPNLLLGFAVWIYWGMIAKYIQDIHFGTADTINAFNFTFMNDGQPYEAGAYKALLFLLPAVAGLAGATLRIPNSFMIAICGGRNVKFMTTLLLVIPALGAGIALQNPDTPFYIFVILAALSGVGGGAFSSSMSNISFFYPKKAQGLALGLNAGLGNLGVSVMQFLIPWVITFGVFGDMGGDAYTYVKKGAEAQMWIQNAGLVWVPIGATCLILAFFFMDNMPFHKTGTTIQAVTKYLWLTLMGFAGAAVGIAVLLATYKLPGKTLWTFVVVLVAVPVTLLCMRYLTPTETKENLKEQFSIFNDKHNWIMTYLYIMTFGSFIGYANAFPKLIKDVFEVEPGPYAWIGAGVGALIRPVGGWLSDKLGGARVTHWDTIIMIAATVGAGYLVQQAMGSDNPKQFFIPFLLTFIVLFATTGIGNGSTFRMIGVIFEKDQRGPVLGWTAAIAAYGAYLIPKIFGNQIVDGTPHYALYGFAIYYVTCLGVNWWFYARKGAEKPC